MISDNLHDPPAKSVDRSLGLLDDWERLRLLYNAILAGEVALMSVLTSPLGMIGLRDVYGLILNALLANLCYCAGPVADGYFRRLGFQGRVPTLTLFTLGTMLTMGLAFLDWIGFFLKGFD